MLRHLPLDAPFTRIGTLVFFFFFERAGSATSPRGSFLGERPPENLGEGEILVVARK